MDSRSNSVPSQQQKILILAAIPHGLRLDKEIREIEEAIRRAAKRDLFETRLRTAVRPVDLRRAIAEEQPQIVHFCGHGLEDGSLLLEDEGGNNKPVSPEALASLFKLYADSVKCVLLNACYSEKAAVAISQDIDYVIGMNNLIQDRAAIEFARGFYDGLGFQISGNQDVFQRAFDEAMVAIQIEKPSQEQIPVLKISASRRGVRSSPEIYITDLPVPEKYFVNRDEELKKLDDAWKDSKKTNVISLVAGGGVGKTELINEWLRRLKEDNWRGAQYVLGYSFHGQGKSGAHTSSDLFISKALKWVGDTHPEDGSSQDKAERLAHRLSRTKTLLILDGIEPLQKHVSSYDSGMIKDDALAILVRTLNANNAGLCLITTRIDIRDIPNAPIIRLPELSPEMGASLLELLGVNGNGRPDLLKKASEDALGHGLTLRLLGNYLCMAYKGDISRINEVKLVEEDPLLGGPITRMMKIWEDFLDDGPELSILRLLGLFDRPAKVAYLQELCKVPVIKGLTDSLVRDSRQNRIPAKQSIARKVQNFICRLLTRKSLSLKEKDWNWAIENLRHYGLVKNISETAPQNQNAETTLETHPLIREYFASQITNHFPKKTREAHRRLYEHLKKEAPKKPDNIQDMEPLYHAVMHGCKAGLAEEALKEVFLERIQRDGEYFNTRILGAIGVERETVSYFFETPWSQLLRELKRSSQGEVLRLSGFLLRALGRLDESEKTMYDGLKIAQELEDWQTVAEAAAYLSNLNCLRADFPKAFKFAQMSIEYADRSDNNLWKAISRSHYATALHLVGKRKEAKQAFADSTRQWNSSHKDLDGYIYYYLWDLQLEDIQLQQSQPKQSYEQLRNHIGATLNNVRDTEYPLLSEALDYLMLGRIFLVESQVSPGSVVNLLKQAKQNLDKSKSLFYQAKTEQEKPRCLLAQASLYRCKGKWQSERGSKSAVTSFDQANQSLDKVKQIVQRSGMVMFQIETSLERCRLELARGNYEQARDQINAVKHLVKTTKKTYKPLLPSGSEWQPPDYVLLFKDGENIGYNYHKQEITTIDEKIRRVSEICQ